MNNSNCHFGLLPQSASDWFFKYPGRAQTSYNSPWYVHSHPIAVPDTLSPEMSSWLLAPLREHRPGQGVSRRGRSDGCFRRQKDDRTRALMCLNLRVSTFQRELPAWVAVERELCSLETSELVLILAFFVPLSLKSAAHFWSCHISVHSHQSAKPCIHILPGFSVKTSGFCFLSFLCFAICPQLRGHGQHFGEFWSLN